MDAALVNMESTGSTKQVAPAGKPVRSLLFSTLYPSEARPRHGAFVETRLRKLLDTGLVDARVVAPVPWFPSTHRAFGHYALFARTPQRERRFDIDVLHPRYLLAPKFGMHGAPLSLALGALGSVRALIAEGFDFDLIDAHYFYPDGVAAALLASWLGKPFIVTARGSDVNIIGRFRLPGAQMRWAARRAAANIAVSVSLADIITGWGIDPSLVHVLRNGVDCDVFRPVEPAYARAALQLRGDPLLLAVGNLVPLKRHAIAIDTLEALMPAFPGISLLIVGEGPELGELRRHAARRGVSGRVNFTGAVAQSSLPMYYSAADVMLLPSEREGWPNVVLESLACGTPVVASDVGGLREIITDGTLGALVDPHSPGAYAQKVAALLRQPPSRERLRAYAQGMGWQSTSEKQLELFRRAASTRHH
jgi:teichuronic acid biosynthesis glycosyltransferase TuaC